MSNLKKLSVSEKFGYLCSGIAYNICMLIPAFLIFYATESLAIGIGSVSLMMVVVKIVDGITDIIAGIIIDKTKSKKGKARPWFLRAGIPYAICIFLLFSVPADLGTGTKLVFLTIFYALTVSVFGTLIGVARYAIVPRMTSNVKEQGALGVLGDGVGVVFMGLGLAVTMIFVGKIGWSGAFGIYALLTLAASLLCYALTREKTEEISQAIDDVRNKEKSGIKDIFATIFTNKYALLAFVIVFLQQLAGGAIATSGTYYFQHVIGNIGYFNQMMGIATILCLIGMVVCTFITKKIGPKNMFIMGGRLTVLCYIVVLISGTGRINLLVIVMAFAMLFGQTFCASNFAAFASSSVIYGEKKSGVRAEGLSSAVINIGVKLGTAAATALVGLVLSIGGYLEGGVQQTDAAIQSVSGAFIFIPMIFFALVTIVVAFTYNIDKDLAKIN